MNKDKQIKSKKIKYRKKKKASANPLALGSKNRPKKASHLDYIDALPMEKNPSYGYNALKANVFDVTHNTGIGGHDTIKEDIQNSEPNQQIDFEHFASVEFQPLPFLKRILSVFGRNRN